MPATKLNVNENQIAISGYDPVSYFTGDEPRKGSPQFTAEYEGATYHFVSAENQAAFEADPAKYAPQYGGWCAVAVSEGKYFPVDPQTYEVSGEKLYLFYNGEQGNTLPQWQAERDNRRKNADENWQAGNVVDHE